MADIAAAIAPGSVPYGERGALESGISQSQATPKLPVAASPISPQDPFSGGPMSALMGDGGFGSDKPVTSGLSMGPGSGPATDLSNLPMPLIAKLQDVALNAKNPQLRGAALLALRRIVRQRNRQE